MVSVIGLNVFGLAYSACLAKAGIKILATDLDDELVMGIQEAAMPSFETGLDQYYQEAVNTQNLEITTNVRKVINDSKIIFITGIITIEDEVLEGLRFIRLIIQKIAGQMTDDKVIVIQSTVPPGTFEKMKILVEETLQQREWEKQEKPKYSLVISPIFSNAGALIKDLKRPKMAVLGIENGFAAQELTDIYQQIGVKENAIFLTSPIEAETARYFIDGFRAVKMSYMNEMALLFDRIGVDMNLQRQIAEKNPHLFEKQIILGAGFGGKQFNQNLQMMINFAKNQEMVLEMLEAAVTTNKKQAMAIVEKIQMIVGSLEGKTIAVLGIAAFPGSDDLSEAPSLTIIKEMINQGANVSIFSYEGFTEVKWRLYKESSQISFSTKPIDAGRNADAIVVLSKWPEASKLNLEKLAAVAYKPLLIDVCNAFFKRKRIKELFDYYPLGIGREE